MAHQVILTHLNDNADSITSTQPPSSPSPTDSNESDELQSEPQAATLLEVAALSAIVQITMEDFFLTSNGGYRRPNKFVKALAHIKPLCTGGLPEVEPFNADFTTAMANLCWLLNEASTEGFTVKHGVVTDAGRIKVRHILFEVSPCTS